MTKIRIRIHYAKKDALKYTGNLDIHKIWERSFRRAGLPLAYSQGYQPKPRLNQASPLPLGISSRAELVDAWLEQEIPTQQIAADLKPALPTGIEILSVEIIDSSAPKLQTNIKSSEYQVTLLEETPTDLDFKIETLMAQSTIMRQRRKKQYDLRPLIETLQQVEKDPQGRTQIHMHLSASEGATGRPDEVMLALDIDPFTTRIERTQLHFKSQP